MIVRDIVAKHIEGMENELLYGTSTKPEPTESVLTIGMLNELFDKMPEPSDDKIFVVDTGYWPHNCLTLTKDNGKHFILNREGFCNLKIKCKTVGHFQTSYAGFSHFSGVKIEYISAEEAAELIADHCGVLN